MGQGEFTMSGFDDVDRAMKAVEQEIERLRAQTGEDVLCGAIPCPICEDGTLMWIIMPNGHSHGDCNNPTGCIGWAQ